MSAMFQLLSTALYGIVTTDAKFWIFYFGMHGMDDFRASLPPWSLHVITSLKYFRSCMANSKAWFWLVLPWTTKTLPSILVFKNEWSRYLRKGSERILCPTLQNTSVPHGWLRVMALLFCYQNDTRTGRSISVLQLNYMAIITWMRLYG